MLIVGNVDRCAPFRVKQPLRCFRNQSVDDNVQRKHVAGLTGTEYCQSATQISQDSSMSLRNSRVHNQLRFLFFATLALFLVASFNAVAQAQEGGGGGGSNEPLVLFMLNAVGWIFGPLLMGI